MKWLTLSALLLTLSCFVGQAQSKDESESLIRAHRWGAYMLVATQPQWGSIYLLLANGPFEPCGISTEGGGAAIVRSTTKVTYGCWAALQKDKDVVVWVRLNGGAEVFVPISDLRKRPYDPEVVGPPDLWTEHNLENVGRRIANHLNQTDQRIRMLISLTPSFTSDEKAAAAICLESYHDKLRQYVAAMGAIHAEHQRISEKWPAPNELDEATLEVRRQEIGMLVETAEKLALRTFSLDQDLKQCLRSRNIPFQ